MINIILRVELEVEEVIVEDGLRVKEQMEPMEEVMVSTILVVTPTTMVVKDKVLQEIGLFCRKVEQP